MSGPGDSDLVLVLNAGSSSIKLAVFDGALTQILTGIADGIGGPGTLKLGHVKTTQAFPDHATALHAILQALENQGLSNQPLCCRRASCGAWRYCADPTHAHHA